MVSIRPWHLAVFACIALVTVLVVAAILAISSRRDKR
jgi:hypothetical protein